MEAEEREAFHKRIDRAKRGRGGFNKITFSNDFIIVSGNVIGDVPALTRFQGF